MGVWLEIVVIVILTVLNGMMAMSEIAIISAKKVRLQRIAAKGSRGAQRALELGESPNRFLSTVQIGITLIGILMGAFAGATISEELAALLRRIPLLEAAAEVLALAMVVGLITYLSLVIGELVPKRIGMQNPERVAVLVAPLMHWLSIVTAPFVHLLSRSTDLVLRLFRIKSVDDSATTEEDIRSLIKQGIQTGVFEEREHDMVVGVFGLDDRKISSVMTPRTEVDWVNLDDPLETNLQVVMQSQHSVFPAAHGSLDQVVGVIRAKDLLNRMLSKQPVDLESCIRETLFIPETAAASHTLELFKQSGKHTALVISEYGGTEGLVTLNDLVEQIVGWMDEPEAVQRSDNSWLVDGLLTMESLYNILGLEETPSEVKNQTLGGFVMEQLEQIPRVADHFEWQGIRFEVVDMDGKRVDKVLVQMIQ